MSRIRVFFEQMLADIAAQGFTAWLKGTAAMTAFLAFVEWLQGRSPLEIILLALVVMVAVVGFLELLALRKKRMVPVVPPEAPGDTSVETDKIAAQAHLEDVRRKQDKQDQLREGLRGSETTPKIELPIPDFRSPRQTASTEREPHLSWWHVPISVHKPLETQLSTIERCMIQWVDENSEVHDLRWQSRKPHNQAGDAEKTLEYGRTYLVPIAERRESISEKPSRRIAGCERTGEKSLLHQRPDHLAPGKHDFRLRIKAGANSWDSPHKYRLTVPPFDATNSHFTLEIRYDDDG